MSEDYQNENDNFVVDWEVFTEDENQMSENHQVQEEEQKDFFNTPGNIHFIGTFECECDSVMDDNDSGNSSIDSPVDSEQTDLSNLDEGNSSINSSVKVKYTETNPEKNIIITARPKDNYLELKELIIGYKIGKNHIFQGCKFNQDEKGSLSINDNGPLNEMKNDGYLSFHFFLRYCANFPIPKQDNDRFKKFLRDLKEKRNDIGGGKFRSQFSFNYNDIFVAEEAYIKSKEEYKSKKPPGKNILENCEGFISSWMDIKNNLKDKTFDLDSILKNIDSKPPQSKERVDFLAREVVSLKERVDTLETILRGFIYNNNNNNNNINNNGNNNGNNSNDDNNNNNNNNKDPGNYNDKNSDNKSDNTPSTDSGTTNSSSNNKRKRQNENSCMGSPVDGFDSTSKNETTTTEIPTKSLTTTTAVPTELGINLNIINNDIIDDNNDYSHYHSDNNSRDNNGETDEDDCNDSVISINTPSNDDHLSKPHPLIASQNLNLPMSEDHKVEEEEDYFEFAETEDESESASIMSTITLCNTDDHLLQHLPSIDSLMVEDNNHDSGSTTVNALVDSELTDLERSVTIPRSPDNWRDIAITETLNAIPTNSQTTTTKIAVPTDLSTKIFIIIASILCASLIGCNYFENNNNFNNYSYASVDSNNTFTNYNKTKSNNFTIHSNATPVSITNKSFVYYDLNTLSIRSNNSISSSTLSVKKPNEIDQVGVVPFHFGLLVGIGAAAVFKARENSDNFSFNKNNTTTTSILINEITSPSAYYLEPHPKGLVQENDFSSSFLSEKSVNKGVKNEHISFELREEVQHPSLSNDTLHQQETKVLEEEIDTKVLKRNCRKCNTVEQKDTKAFEQKEMGQNINTLLTRLSRINRFNSF